MTNQETQKTSLENERLQSQPVLEPTYFDPVAFATQELLVTRSGKPDGRRVDSAEKKVFQVEAIWDRTKEIIRLSSMGWKQVEIANHLGITPACVSYTINSPLVRHQIDVIQAGRDSATLDVLQQIKDMAPKALALHDQVMDDDSIPLPMRQASAREVRSWMEFVMPKKTQQTNIGALLSLEDIREIRSRAIANGQAKAENKAIEIKPESISNVE